MHINDFIFCAKHDENIPDIIIDMAGQKNKYVHVILEHRSIILEIVNYNWFMSNPQNYNAKKLRNSI